MQKYIVKILPKTKDFESELLDFLFEKSTHLKRDFSIVNILKNDFSPTTIYDLFRNDVKIELDDLYGSTFQSYWRSNKDVYAISHQIIDIFEKGEDFYASIIPSQYGDIIDFDKGILRPVYYKPDEYKDQYKIATFDIDFNITEDMKS